jgi:hypothetical protein
VYTLRIRNMIDRVAIVDDIDIYRSIPKYL